MVESATFLIFNIFSFGLLELEMAIRGVFGEKRSWSFRN
jgi:hypothetical protein